jgi:GTPase
LVETDKAEGGFALVAVVEEEEAAAVVVVVVVLAGPATLGKSTWLPVAVPAAMVDGGGCPGAAGSTKAAAG